MKRGRGGIREVEFFAQVQQLIHGGRDPALRTPATREALNALAAAGHIDPTLADALAGHYVALRTAEHRLQMVADQQTHRLPDDAAALDNAAALAGAADGAAWLAGLAPSVAAVGAQFDTLIGAGSSPRWPQSAEAATAALSAAGFTDPPAALRRIAQWRGGTMRVLRSAAAQDSLETVLPALIPALAKAADPDTALARFDTLIEGLPSAINFFNLLGARPALLETATTILACAPALAADLARRPALIEGLIDATIFDALPDHTALSAQMRSDGNFERQLDHVRHAVGERRFALGVQLVERTTGPLGVARGYADVADAALATLASATVADFEATHGRVPGGELIVLALGRLGGQALTHASDLDLILLFSGDHLAQSDGDRPLGATRYFNRLGQRLIAALSVPTAAGRLYEVDTRLRPQGNQGPLVASVDAFARYQRDDAWTWEHMALTRARVVHGSASARAVVERIIADVLNAPRDPMVTLADAVRMRADIAMHKPPLGRLDVKLAPGGLIDCEFAIHTTQLIHRTGFDPRLDHALAQLAAEGHAPGDVADAHALLTRMLVTMRLMAPAGDATDAATRARIAEVLDLPDWAALLAAGDAARHSIAAWWAAIRGASQGTERC